MITYLIQAQLMANLRVGKPLEQWLSVEKKQDYAILKWLRIDRERNGGYSTTYFQSFDEGDDDFFDIYAFSPRKSDEPDGVGTSFATAEEAVAFALNQYQASTDRFLPAGMIQAEYESYRRQNG